MSDYSDLIARARTASETLQKGALRSDAHDAKMLNDDAELFDELADAIATLEQTVSDCAEMIDKLKEGISFIQLHQSKRARK